ncbi:MAG: hypothetical protein B7Z37_18045 [Verrucomicrobia bacterium 12-59-8]|nr:MAG: hypothetical protein B7Z37_18045 [Verrucomicrobia bacterium 12-59-8]
MPKLPKIPADSDEKIPPTPPAVMAVLIVVLLCLMGATFKYTFYPNPPPAWSKIHDTPAMPMADVNKILSESGAVIDTIKAVPGGSVETWQKSHRTGTWQIIVNLKQTPAGAVYASEQVRCDISNFPSFTRTWEYPEPAPGSSLAPPTPAAAPAK